MVAMAEKCCLPRVVTRHVFLLAVLSHSATTHAVPSNECGLLAERGDCAFYECIETTYPCGQRGYTLGYGHHYCDRFNVYFHELTSEGQRWMDAVRKCLMKELHNYYVGTDHKTCASIKTFAFLSHPHCYTMSGPGFCTIITDPRNYDALYHGYQLKDFYGDDWKVVWQQVQETAVMCGGLVAQGFVDTLQDLYSSGVSQWRSLFARSGSDAD